MVVMCYNMLIMRARPELPVFYTPTGERPELVYGRADPGRVGIPPTPNIDHGSFAPIRYTADFVPTPDEALESDSPSRIFQTVGRVYMEFESDIKAISETDGPYPIGFGRHSKYKYDPRRLVHRLGRAIIGHESQAEPPRPPGAYYPVVRARYQKWKWNPKSQEHQLEWTDRVLILTGKARGIHADHVLEGVSDYVVAIDAGYWDDYLQKIIWSVERGQMASPKYFSVRGFRPRDPRADDPETLDANPWANPELLKFLKPDGRAYKGHRPGENMRRAASALAWITAYCVAHAAREDKEDITA